MNKYLVLYKRTAKSNFVFTDIIKAEDFEQAIITVRAVLPDDGGEILMVQKVVE